MRVKRKKLLFLSLFVLIIALTIPIILYQKKWASGEIGMLSLSSDGHYAISPDGQYIVSGDNASWLGVWEIKSGKKVVDVLSDEPILKYNSDGSVTGDTNVIPAPADFIDHNTGEVSYSVLAVKFIDATHYLRFSLYVPYTMLYEVTNPKALKYNGLGRHPCPSVDYYARDQAIDTSPSAHILVMGKENEGGILVYQYDPQTQTLTKVWDGE